MKRLTAKQEIFVRSLATGVSPAEAYRRAYHTSATRRRVFAKDAYSLMRLPKLVPFIAAARLEHMRAWEEAGRAAQERTALFAHLGLTRERVIAELAQIAFADLRQIARWDANGNVTFRTSDEIGSAPALAQIISLTRPDGHAVRLKLHDRLGALTILAKIMGLGAKEPGEEADALHLSITLVPPDARKGNEEAGLNSISG